VLVHEFAKAISRQPLPDEAYFMLGFDDESCEYLIAMWLANAMGLDFPGRRRMIGRAWRMKDGSFSLLFTPRTYYNQSDFVDRRRIYTALHRRDR
jgi:hypothetical protein